MAKKKPKVIPFIKGIHPQGERKIIALHFHPDQIKKSLKEIIEVADEQQLKDLFTDVAVLVSWALDRLPLIPPPDKKPASQAETNDADTKGEQ